MKKYTEAGTDIEKVKQQNANSGMSYNEVKEYLAKTMAQNTSPDSMEKHRK
jgi:tryptophanyl-tRNA synthetase